MGLGVNLTVAGAIGSPPRSRTAPAISSRYASPATRGPAGWKVRWMPWASAMPSTAAESAAWTRRTLAASTVAASSGSEKTRRRGASSRNGSGLVPSAFSAAPFTVRTVAASSGRIRVLRAWKVKSGASPARLFAIGSREGRAHTSYAAPSARPPVGTNATVAPSTVTVPGTKPSGPSTQSDPVTWPPDLPQAVSTGVGTGSENVSRMRAPTGTSYCPSRG
jgi:hypothetical protein